MYADHFSIENIPFGIASNTSHTERSVVTRFEDTVIFLDELAKLGLLATLPEKTRRTFSQVPSPHLTWFKSI
jgi:fumarylacetoacetase